MNNKSSYFISKKLLFFLIISTLYIVLVTYRLPYCSDTNNYLTHPGFEKLNLLSADNLLYHLLYLIGDNILWFKYLQTVSVIFFLSGLFIIPINSGRFLLASLIPWFYSIIGLHYWSCGIRNSVSFSLLFFLFCFINSKIFIDRKYLRFIVKTIFAILSLITHWTSIFILPFVLKKTLLNNILEIFNSIFLFKIPKKNIYKNILFILGFLLIVVFGANKLEIYSFFASRQAYGTKFPIVMIVNLIIYYFLHKDSIKKIKEISSLYFLTLVTSASTFFGFTQLVIRFQLAFWILFLVSILIYQRKNAFTFFMLSSPAFLYYLLNNYSLYYLY